jgi:hypothetical protein
MGWSLELGPPFQQSPRWGVHTVLPQPSVLGVFFGGQSQACVGCDFRHATPPLLRCSGVGPSRFASTPSDLCVSTHCSVVF